MGAEITASTRGGVSGVDGASWGGGGGSITGVVFGSAVGGGGGASLKEGGRE